MKRTILITGGGQGIGQAMVYRFASDGSNVVIAAKDQLDTLLSSSSIFAHSS